MPQKCCCLLQSGKLWPLFEPQSCCLLQLPPSFVEIHHAALAVLDHTAKALIGPTVVAMISCIADAHHTVTAVIDHLVVVLVGPFALGSERPCSERP